MEAAPPPAAPLPPPPPRRPLAARLWSAAQFVVALGVTAAFLAYLLLEPAATPPAPPDAPAPLDDLVEVTGPGLIRVKPGGPFAAKVQSVGVRSATVTAPTMAVTGRVVASLRPGMGKGDDYWQFDTPELLTAYTDWRKAQADIPFFETSLAVARKFDAAQLEAQRGVVARLEGLVSAGTDTPKDLASERATLIRYELTGRQAVHEAETAVKNARLVESARDLEGIFVKSVGGTPVYLRDVATVGPDSKVPNGIFSKDRTDEGVEGIVLLRRGENPSQVLARVQEAVADLNQSALPAGVRVVSYYDRQYLVEATLHTVGHSVLLGVTLVVLVLLLFLGRPATALLVAATIPFALLFALLLMYLTNIPIGLLSIGAIDFGIIVDGAVIVAENVARRLGHATEEAGRKGERPDVAGVVLAAVQEMERSVFFSVLMVAVAYLPLLSLTSIEGLLFRPMALTMVYALTGSLLFALFVIPVLAVLLFRGGYREWENPLLRAARPVYALTLRAMLAGRWWVAAGAVCVLAFVGLRVAPRLGFEFLPLMDEGVIWVRANFPEGSSLEQTSAHGKRLRAIALEFPDVQFAVAQAGRNDDGTDPFPPSRVEMMVGP